MQRLFIILLILLKTTTLLHAEDNCLCIESEQANTSAEQLINSKINICKVKGYALSGKEKITKNNLDSAELVLKKGLSIIEDNKCKDISLLEIYKALNLLYRKKADFSNALAIELKMLSILEKQNDTAGIANANYNISVIFFRNNQFDKAMLYCQKALLKTEQLNASSDKAHLYTKIANCYHFYYDKNKSKVYLDSVELYAKKAYEIIQTINVDRKVKFITNTRLSSVAIEKKDYTTSLNLLNNNISLCDRKTDIAELAVNFSDKAYVYLCLNDYSAARKWVDSSLLYTKKINSPPQLANLYQLLFEIEQKLNHPKEALAAYQMERALTDSMLSAKNTETITELEKKYNQEKNVNTIEKLKQQKRIYLLLALIGLLSIIALIFWLRQLSLKHQQNIMETEQRLNRARMNPHFFFNALSSLQSFALRENDGEAIASNLSKFSNIMRETLESTYKEYITIEQEIDFLHEYLDVQKIRFPNKFTYTIYAEPDVEIDELQLPAMILQPFVENSIEHGFNSISYVGDIKISFSKKEKDLVIEIIDNGAGLSAHEKNDTEHISRASQIIKDRIYLLNIKLKSKATFSIDNHPTQQGVLVKIILPLMYI